MKYYISLVLVACSLMVNGQSWQILYDSSTHYLNIGYTVKAQLFAEQLKDGKDAKEQYKKHVLLANIQMANFNMKSSIQYLDKAYAMVKNKSIKLNNQDFIDLQFTYFYCYYEMNEMEKSDSLLELIREGSGKRVPAEYYRYKYNLLKKVGKYDEAAELIDYEIQENYYLYRTLPIEDYIEAEDYEMAAWEMEGVLEELKLIYHKDTTLLEKQFYGYSVQSASSLNDLKNLMSLEIWQDSADERLDWIGQFVNKAYELNEKIFADSIANRLIEESTKTLGAINIHHANTLLAMINSALENDDLIKARKYADKAEAILKALYGEQSVMFRGRMYSVLRYRMALGYDEEVTEFTLRSLDILEKEAGKKHPYYSTYASFYFKNNPKNPAAGQYLQEAVNQYNQDDSNCNGCYALVLSNLASSFEYAGDVKQAELYFRRAWEKSKEAPEQEVHYRKLLTDFYRRCHAMKLRSKLEYFPEEIRVTRNDTIFTTYENLNADMWYVSDLTKNYNDALVKTSATERNGIYFAKAKLEWSENRESEATIAFETTMNEVMKGLEVLDYLNEAEKSRYYKSVSEPINAFYSFSISLNTLSSGYLMEDKYMNYTNERLKTDSTSYVIQKVVIDGKNYNRFTLLHGKKALNMRLATKGMVFASTRKVQNRILNSGDSVLIKEYGQLEQLKKELAAIYIADAEKVKDKEEQIIKLSQQVSALEIQLAEKSSAFRELTQAQKVTFDDIQSKLKPGEAAVEVIRINHPMYYLSDKLLYQDSVYYAFFIITPENKIKPEVVILKNGYELETKFYQAYKNAIKFKLDDLQSYNQFWNIIQKELWGRSKVYFSPDGIYNLISLNTLRNPANGLYLLEQSDITILPDLKILAEINESYGVKKSAVIMGDPAFSESDVSNTKKAEQQDRSFQLADLFSDEIPRLDGTLTEVVSIQKLLQSIQWKTSLFTGTEATESSLKMVENPSLLHIATHGFFFSKDVEFSNPLLLSGLIMADVGNINGLNDDDGVLTAYEAQSLDLSSTELVILSACETGTGVINSGDGVYGLQRAFMTAGSKNVIMSLWTVDDAATSLLMRTFYKEWTNGFSKSAALKKAELEVKRIYPSPYYWGAFVLLGN